MAQLGLALSGGGFRATLFHLGVIRFLRDAGLLGDVSHIVSVSGGSILAAHLALNWDRYTGSAHDFDAAAAKILDFVRLDVRNRIVRRMPFVYPFRVLQQLLLRRENRRFTATGILEGLYDDHLYEKKCVHHLPQKPELHILATNISEGGLCSFSPEGLIVQRRDREGIQVDRLPARLTRISLAVAASSAFPGFFPPVRMTADDLGLTTGQFPTQAFTDGGVYDNLGVRVFDLLQDVAPSLDEILVSDAGQIFRVLPKKPIGLIGQAMRASDILWDRVWQLEKLNFGADPRFLFVPTTDFVDPKEDPTALDPVIQPEIQNIRTDLDRFSPLEIRLLVQHGYCVTRKQCRSKPDVFGENLPSAPPWNPVAGPGQPGETNSGQPALPSTSPETATADGRTIRRSAERRIWSTMLDFRDWPTYVYLPLLFVLFVVLPVLLWRFYRQARADAAVVEAITKSDADFRKILELVHRGAVPEWTPMKVTDQDSPTDVTNQGFEFTTDTHIVDLRYWNPQSRDKAYYFRRIRVKKTSKDDRLIIRYVQPFNRVAFRCGPEKLNPVVRRIPAKAGKRDVTWEVEFDFSGVQQGRIVEVTIEANVYDIAAAKGKGETWLRYRPQLKTRDATVWLLFPSDRSYQHYSLLRYPEADPSDSRPVETRYTVNHPYGSIIAWMVIDPEVGNVYECQWTWAE